MTCQKIELRTINNKLLRSYQLSGISDRYVRKRERERERQRELVLEHLIAGTRRSAIAVANFSQFIAVIDYDSKHFLGCETVYTNSLLLLLLPLQASAHGNFKSSPVAKTGGSTSESEDAGGGGGRRDSPLSMTVAHLGGGNVGAASALSGLSQSLSIKQELMDAHQQQQQQHREHHVALPPDYTVS